MPTFPYVEGGPVLFVQLHNTTATTTSVALNAVDKRCQHVKQICASK